VQLLIAHNRDLTDLPRSTATAHALRS